MTYCKFEEVSLLHSIYDTKVGLKILKPTFSHNIIFYLFGSLLTLPSGSI